jgi:hypothetical protein
MRFVLSLIPRKGESPLQQWIRRAKYQDLVIPVGAGVVMFMAIGFCVVAPLVAVALGRWAS